MLDLTNLTIGLEDFAKQIIVDAKENLTKGNTNASGKLSESLIFNRAIVRQKSLEISVNMKPYGAFIDQGVSGVDVKYDTKFSYTNKKPPPSALDGWMVKRGIAPRNKTGQFLDRKAIQWAISTSIFHKGIKPRKFLTNAVEKNFKLLPEMIRDKFSLDVKNTVQLLIKTNFNKK